jgi:hypothetical protein
LQYLGRFSITLTAAGTFTKTATPVYSPDLDPLMEVTCDISPTAKCTVPKDTMMILPNSYTRIGFNTPAASGLYTWLR